MNGVVVGVETVALPRKGRRAIEVEHRWTESRRYPRAERRLAAEVPLRIGQGDWKSTLSLERLEVRLLRGVGLRSAGGELRGESDARRNRRRPERQLGDEAGERLGVEAEECAH